MLSHNWSAYLEVDYDVLKAFQISFDRVAILFATSSRPTSPQPEHQPGSSLSHPQLFSVSDETYRVLYDPSGDIPLERRNIFKRHRRRRLAVTQDDGALSAQIDEVLVVHVPTKGQEREDASGEETGGLPLVALKMEELTGTGPETAVEPIRRKTGTDTHSTGAPEATHTEVVETVRRVLREEEATRPEMEKIFLGMLSTIQIRYKAILTDLVETALSDELKLSILDPQATGVQLSKSATALTCEAYRGNLGR